MSIHIRFAEKEDCARLLELIRELARYEHAEDEVTVSLEEFIDAGFGTNPVWKSFVAEEHGQVIGLALYYIRYSTWKGCRLYLEDFLVTESYRGRGVGKLLFDRTVQEARKQNYNGMTWQVLDWNEPAINFYKKYKSSFDGGWLNVSFSREQIHDVD